MHLSSFMNPSLKPSVVQLPETAELTTLRLVFINAGCRFRNSDRLEAWVTLCEETGKGFDVCYMSEIDAVSDSRFQQSIADFTIFRHYQRGSRAMAWLTP